MITHQLIFYFLFLVNLSNASRIILPKRFGTIKSMASFASRTISRAISSKPKKALAKSTTVKLVKKVKPKPGIISEYNFKVESSEPVKEAGSKSGTIEPNFENFLFCENLGSGAFGSVYRTRIEKKETSYSAKVIADKAFVDRKDAEKAIIKEAEIHKMIDDSPFIVKFHGLLKSDLEKKAPLVQIFDHVKGVNLLTFYQENKDKLTEADIKLFAAEMIAGINHLQSKRVAWRDMKPENILVDENGHLKFIDFGFAVSYGPKAHKESSEIAGTLRYIPPEVLALACGASEKRFRPKRIDWYSLGCILYELFFGKVPFEYDVPESEEGWKTLLESLKKLPDCLDKEKGYCGSKIMNENASKLIQGLLEADSEKRMKFVKSIKEHSWFSIGKKEDQNEWWEKVGKGDIEPKIKPEKSLIGKKEKCIKKSEKDINVELGQNESFIMFGNRVAHKNESDDIEEDDS